MKITYTARKVNLRDNFKERVEKKLLKFEKLFSEDAVANVVVTLEKNRQTVEITIRDNGMVYRVESTMPEMNDALDKVTDMLMRQIRKHKTKVEKNLRENAFAGLAPEPEETDYEVIRYKNFKMKPMTVEEAILQMNLLGHTFFMFKNAESGIVNVVYKRDEGNYAVLVPEDN